jgi:glyoxylase-like metal-dependent hydrolase (beta-lactamase superfamily II)
MVSFPLFPYYEEKTADMIQVEAMPFNNFQVNTYLVWDETKECLVVDPSFYGREEQEKKPCSLRL